MTKTADVKESLTSAIGGFGLFELPVMDQATLWGALQSHFR